MFIYVNTCTLNFLIRILTNKHITLFLLQMAMLILLVLCLRLVFVTSHTTDVKQEYFTTAVFPCEYDRYNFTSNSPIKSKYWLLPNSTYLNRNHNTNGSRVYIDANFTLTVQHIDDDDFGYYFCLLIRDDHSIDSIRLGLNTDGPYFGDLAAIYAKKAMIGAIAGGSLFLILAGSCLVNQFRYHKRSQRNKAVDDLDKAIDGYDLKSYNNVGAELEDEVVIRDKGDGVMNGDTATAEVNKF